MDVKSFITLGPVLILFHLNPFQLFEMDVSFQSLDPKSFVGIICPKSTIGL